MVDFFAKHKADADVPQATRKYMADSVPAHEQIKKLADEQMAKIDKLGDLKVDDLQRAL